jgi:hypothetical protein
MLILPSLVLFAAGLIWGRIKPVPKKAKRPA